MNETRVGYYYQLSAGQTPIALRAKGAGQGPVWGGGFQLLGHARRSPEAPPWAVGWFGPTGEILSPLRAGIGGCLREWAVRFGRGGVGAPRGA